MMTLGEKIKACRQAAGMSQEKVAELVGVSRQAVTKWEANQSAPNTENLFKLAEIFGTTVDFLLTSQEAERSPAEQIHQLYKLEEEKKAKARRDKLRSNLLLTLAVIGGYLFIYLAAMAISAIPALFGKQYFSFTTLLGFAIALLVGELCGHNPAGAAYAHGHYGWAIWGFVFAFSVVTGMILEKIAKKKLDLRSKKLRIWLAVYAVGVLAIVLAVRASMPTSYS